VGASVAAPSAREERQRFFLRFPSRANLWVVKREIEYFLGFVLPPLTFVVIGALALHYYFGMW
jgi:hypothetical protein